MSNGIDRWGISGLSRENQDFAEPEEIIVDKEIGQFYIKSKDGDVISSDSEARFSSSLFNFENLISTLGLTGDLSSIELETIQLPHVFQPEANILPAEIQIKDIELEKILLYVDMDYLKVENSIAIRNTLEPSIALKFALRHPTYSEIEVGYECQLNQLKQPIILKDHADTGATDVIEYKIFLTEIKIKNNVGIQDEVMKYIVHNIFILC